MAAADRFWVGPLGLLRVLPPISWSESVSAPTSRIGGASSGLDGTLTVTALGSKKQWDFSWPALTPDEVGPLEAAWLNLSDATLRMVDQRRRNRLSRDGSSGGSYSRDPTAHTTTAGTPSFVAVTDYPTSVPWYGLVDGGISWPVPASTAATLRIDDTDRVPLVPSEQITITPAVKGSGSAQVGVQYYDIAGATAGTSLASSVTLGAWAQYSHTFTPSSTQVAGSLIVVAASGSLRTLTIGPATWRSGTGSWVPGTGCPVVEFVDFATTYVDPDDEMVALTVREV